MTSLQIRKLTCAALFLVRQLISPFSLAVHRKSVFSHIILFPVLAMVYEKAGLSLNK